MKKISKIFFLPLITGFMVERFAENPIAAEIRSKMNISADPCEDFEEYVCGGMNSAVESPWNAAQDRIYDTLERSLSGPPTTGGIGKAQELYNVCLNTTEIDQMSTRHLKAEVVPFLNFPTMKVKNAPVQLDMQLITAWTKFGQNPIFSTTYGLGQPPLAMSGSFYLTDNADDFQRYKRAYIRYITKFGQKFRREFSPDLTVVSDRKIRRMAKKIFNFELNIAKLMSTPTELRNVSVTYQPLGDLPANDIVKNWTNFFQTAATKSVETFYKTETSEVQIYDEKWINSISTAIQKANMNKHDLLDFIAWRVYMSLVPYLGSDWRRTSDRFELEIFGTSEKSRSLECARKVNYYMPYATGKIYVDASFSADTKFRLGQMTDEIKTAFSTDMLNDATWMTNGTKLKVKSKIDAITSYFGYSSTAYADSAYETYQIDATNYLKTILGIRAKFANFNFFRAENFINSASVNAYYSPSSNYINILPGIIQEPFYNPAHPAAMNFGGIGTVIGHEITHALDDRDSKYDQYGFLAQWDPVDRQNYEDRVQCIKNEYSQFYDVDAGEHLNGDLTVNENIADNGGIWVAHYAYENWRANNTEKFIPGLSTLFSDDELFYISYGQLWCSQHGTKKSIQSAKRQVDNDPHSPGMFRINGVVKNHTPFGATFGCSADNSKHPTETYEPMTPKNTCRVW